MTAIVIGVMPQEKIRERVLAIVRGAYKPKSGEPKIWFTSMKSLAEVLSDDNRALLQAITEVNPESISALAEATGRKVGNLLRTLKTMSRYAYRRDAPGEESRPAHCEGDGVSDRCRVINSLRETVLAPPPGYGWGACIADLNGSLLSERGSSRHTEASSTGTDTRSQLLSRYSHQIFWPRRIARYECPVPQVG